MTEISSLGSESSPTIIRSDKRASLDLQVGSPRQGERQQFAERGR